VKTATDTATKALQDTYVAFANDTRLSVKHTVMEDTWGNNIDCLELTRTNTLDAYDTDRRGRTYLAYGVRVIREDEGYIKIVNFDNGWSAGTATFAHDIPQAAINATIAAWMLLA